MITVGYKKNNNHMFQTRSWSQSRKIRKWLASATLLYLMLKYLLLATRGRVHELGEEMTQLASPH